MVATILDQFKETRSSPALVELVQAADTGDAAALARLREVYAEAPDIATVVSSLQYTTEQEVLSNFQPGARETFSQQAQRWRKRLAGDDPSPLEELLVNRVVLDQLHALRTEHTLQRGLADSLSLEQAEYHQRQAERAQRRFLRSAKALAEVRRLIRPVVQVNVADQQVNIAGNVRPRPEGVAA